MCWGGVPLGRAGAGAGPLQNCVLVALLGLGDWAPSPEGRGGGGEAVPPHPRFLSAAGRVPFAYFSARLLVHSSAEILPRALRGLGLLLGPAGVPGLEERRAEWLTTL